MIIRKNIINRINEYRFACGLISSECRPEDMVFFDIETTGLESISSSVYLIGYMNIEDGRLILTQLFAEDNSEETNLCEMFFTNIDSKKYLVHFNGMSFDIPFLESKGITLKKFASFDIYKILKPFKNRLGVSSMSQKSLERYCGLNRDDIYDGGQLIDFYLEFLAVNKIHKLRKDLNKTTSEIQNSNDYNINSVCNNLNDFNINSVCNNSNDFNINSVCNNSNDYNINSVCNNSNDFNINSVYINSNETGRTNRITDLNINSASGLPYLSGRDSKFLLDTLLLHNYEDVCGMLTVSGLLTVNRPEAIFTDAPEIIHSGNTVSVKLILNKQITSDTSSNLFITKLLKNASDTFSSSFDSEAISVSCLEEGMIYTLSVREVSMKLYFENYRDYYYLPGEGTVIPKSIGSFIDSSLKENATPQNCYSERHDLFIPVRIFDSLPSAKTTAKSKSTKTGHETSSSELITVLNKLHVFRENYNSIYGYITLDEFKKLSSKELTQILFKLIF